ncbi:MAG: GNAT family N-acetyltransferase [Chloroflexi bacterium]|nr:GNAT family N-acetyltransferase [Chloroflexota bacterium]
MNAHPWQVCPPKLADATPLAAIATAVSPTNIATPTQISQTIQQANGRFWTITQQQQPIGYAALLPIPGLPHLLELVGGIDPNFQRQGAGSLLCRFIKEAVLETAVQQITATVSNLNTPTAHFLYRHQFSFEHEEWTMELVDLQTAVLPTPASLPCHLQTVERETAVHILPTLYQRCFAHTPWLQPYSTTEVAAIWKATDQFYTLVEKNMPIGFIWLHFLGDNVVEIEPIGIVQEKQRMGYGRFLLTSILTKLQKQGTQIVTLGVWSNNQPAIHLYQELGFCQISSKSSLAFSMPQT